MKCQTFIANRLLHFNGIVVLERGKIIKMVSMSKLYLIDLFLVPLHPNATCSLSPACAPCQPCNHGLCICSLFSFMSFEALLVYVAFLSLISSSCVYPKIPHSHIFDLICLLPLCTFMNLFMLCFTSSACRCLEFLTLKMITHHAEAEINTLSTYCLWSCLCRICGNVSSNPHLLSAQLLHINIQKRGRFGVFFILLIFSPPHTYVYNILYKSNLKEPQV